MVIYWVTGNFDAGAKSDSISQAFSGCLPWPDRRPHCCPGWARSLTQRTGSRAPHSLREHLSGPCCVHNVGGAGDTAVYEWDRAPCFHGLHIRAEGGERGTEKMLRKLRGRCRQWRLCWPEGCTCQGGCCGLNCVSPHPKFICWSSNSLVPRNVTVFGNRVVENIIC